MTTHEQCVEAMAGAIYESHRHVPWESVIQEALHDFRAKDVKTLVLCEAESALKADPLRQKLGENWEAYMNATPEQIAAFDAVLKGEAVVIPEYLPNDYSLYDVLYQNKGGIDSRDVNQARLDKPQPEAGQ